MKKDYTKLVFIVDRSGSMGSIVNDVIGGYNNFIAEQKALKHGTCDVSFYQFDTVYEMVYENVRIDDVQKLDTQTFIPRGGTSLLDAVGTTVKNLGNTLASLPESERPEKVLVIIITDGDENSSREYSWEQVKTAVELQTNTYKWQFTYIGANQNAWNVGKNLGVASAGTLTYAANSLGTARAFASLSSNVGSYRSSFGTGSFTYTVGDVKAQYEAGVSTAIVPPSIVTTGVAT